jgi:probable phosphoglycerate mutase
MNLPLQIYLFRHGETAWSLSGQHTGRTDLPLTPHGQAMASDLAPQLTGIAFSLVLTSPRLRARATCELAGLGASAQIDPDLAEWDYGAYEGQRSVEIHQHRPAWDLWEDGCPGGEMPADASRRADRLIARLIDNGDNSDNGDIGTRTGNVALFSHGQFGRVLAARWIGLPVAQGQHFALAPASISILGFETDYPNRRVILQWNATGRSHTQAPPASVRRD